MGIFGKPLLIYKEKTSTENLAGQNSNQIEFYSTGEPIKNLIVSRDAAPNFYNEESTNLNNIYLYDQNHTIVLDQYIDFEKMITTGTFNLITGATTINSITIFINDNYGKNWSVEQLDQYGNVVDVKYTLSTDYTNLQSSSIIDQRDPQYSDFQIFNNRLEFTLFGVSSSYLNINHWFNNNPSNCFYSFEFNNPRTITLNNNTINSVNGFNYYELEDQNHDITVRCSQISYHKNYINFIS